MWRQHGQKRTAPSESLEEALTRIFSDRTLMAQAEKSLQAAAAAEPLVAEIFLTPQSLPYHAEGPFLDTHVRRMLATLQAICNGQLHVRDIEEFRRLKGFEGEIDELQETVCERQAFFEVFALCHDVAKYVSATPAAKSGSRGAELGFSPSTAAAWEDEGIAERALLRRRYIELYRAFAAEHTTRSPVATQADFFLAYAIQVHYPGHDTLIHAPVYQALLQRIGTARRLPKEDIVLLEDIIAHHLQPLTDFEGATAPRPERMSRYVGLAKDRGYDADDFIDILQAGFFLDVVAGSCVWDGKRAKQDASTLIHFFEAEHAYAPWKRIVNELARTERHKRERNARFRTVGLDGLALLDLLHMEPGPAFGAKINEIYEAIEGNGTMPVFPSLMTSELQRRIEKYYEMEFGVSS